MSVLKQNQVSRLLHNKFVVVLGDSIQRSVYKDLVLLLQKDGYLSSTQLRSKGELSFEKDRLVEGGRLGHMTNGIEYREVRQFRSDHHLVRFYFLTRVYSKYLESVLADMKGNLKPDVIIINSCLWDVSRYSRGWDEDYRENLHKLFSHLKKILHPDCLVIWNMAMPLGKKIIGGFMVPEIEDMMPKLRYDVVEANFYSAMLADAYGLDVLDLHFQFRFSLHHRTRDGVHWNALAHRRISCLLLEHAALAWGVQLHEEDSGKKASEQMMTKGTHKQSEHKERKRKRTSAPAVHHQPTCPIPYYPSLPNPSPLFHPFPFQVPAPCYYPSRGFQPYSCAYHVPEPWFCEDLPLLWEGFGPPVLGPHSGPPPQRPDENRFVMKNRRGKRQYNPY